MYASKLPQPSAPIVARPKADLVPGKKSPAHLDPERLPGRSSPLMMMESFGPFGSDVGGVPPQKILEAGLQGKEESNEKPRNNPSDVFKAGGTPLDATKKAKYGSSIPWLDVDSIQEYRGDNVDRLLGEQGLYGLAYLEGFAVSSDAPPGTEEHEITHVARQQQGVYPTESNYQALETDADKGASLLSSGRPLPLHGKISAQTDKADAMQGKCAECKQEEAKKRLQGKEEAPPAKGNGSTKQIVEGVVEGIEDGLGREVYDPRVQGGDPYEALLEAEERLDGELYDIFSRLSELIDRSVYIQISAFSRFPENQGIGICFHLHGLGIVGSMILAIAACLNVRENGSYPAFCVGALFIVAQNWRSYYKCLKDNPGPLNEEGVSLIDAIEAELAILENVLERRSGSD